MNYDDKKTLKELYAYICKGENIVPINLVFKRVGRGGAVCGYRGNKPIYIAIDMQGIQVGSAYALCHEVAHQIEISTNGNHTHNRVFKKTFDRLYKAYGNCLIARKLIW